MPCPVLRLAEALLNICCAFVNICYALYYHDAGSDGETSTEIAAPRRRRRMADEKVPEYAVYYPDLVSCVPVDIYGVRLNASHNAGAVSYENRHFIDVDLWKELKEENPHLEEAVAPHPPCKRLNGTRVEGGNVVIAMLKNQVKVTLVKATKDTDGKKIKMGIGVDIMLNNVLLVHNLPVPLHISTKADRSLKITGAFNSDGGPDMKKENFPERYRDHAYWNQDIKLMPLVDGLKPYEFDKLSAGLDRCMLEGDGKDARNELAMEYGWRPIHVSHSGTESWEHEETGDRIDYYPMTDRAKTSVKSDVFHESSGSPSKKDLVRDNIGGIVGLAKIFEDIHNHSVNGIVKKE